MAIRQQDIKLLWGKSGNRCAICRRELSFDPERGSPTLPIGEQAHIVAQERDGPRGNSILTQEERDRYANLILLCPTDHGIVDKAPEDYPVEKLHSIKTEHELWVSTRLAEGDNEGDTAQLIYS